MSLDTVSISFQIDGTTNDGEIVSFTTKGSLPVQGVNINRIDVTSSRTLWDVDNGDPPFSYAVLINDGANDCEVRVVDSSGATYSLAIPAGAIVTIPYQWTGSVGTQADILTVLPYTSTTTTLKYFIFT